MPSLGDCPDEIIRHVLWFVSPEDNLAVVQCLSRRFYHLGSESLLWRRYCRTSFTYWHPDHDIENKFVAVPSSVAWKALWITRKRSTARVSRLLDSILATKVGQLWKLQEICLLGYDAKDYLLEQCHIDDSAEDVLARRYYANSALDSIHRGLAVDVWSKYQSDPQSTLGLDRALGAFDMFVLHDQPQDLDYISRSFDSLAERFRQECPGLEHMSTRQKALALVRWLRSNNLTGMKHSDNYRNLRNCLIGHALSDDEHPSLPLISSAIFCCIAERLGMISACCSFPFHAHATVLAPPGQTLDGHEENSPDAEQESMFLNPFGSDDEATLHDLRMKLVELGWTQTAEAFLKASPVPVIVQRAAQNIKGAHAEIHNTTDNEARVEEMKRLRTGHPDLNLEAAYYSSMWADLLTKRPSSQHWDASLNLFLNRFALSWSEDLWIVEKYLVPLYDAFVNAQPQQRQREGWESVHQILAVLRNLDGREATPSRRYTEEICKRVRYKIGQVFRHKRYGYIGIINGWDANGTRSLPMPHYPPEGGETDEEVFITGDYGSRLGGPRTFYTCLRPTIDRVRVSQENIEIITDPSLIPETLFFLAGKFFKRFDRDTCTFVSNLKELYPDD